MAEDLYKIGVIARIKQVVHTADNGIKLHVEGIERAEIMSVVQNEPYLTGSVVRCANRSPHATPQERKRSAALHRRDLKSTCRWFRQVPPDILLGVMQQKDCGDLADFIAANISLRLRARSSTFWTSCDPEKPYSQGSMIF